ncbi:MAG: stage 0 sporulation family protein [Atribacterota bacterium]|nr:stage 0 sporulation family protein [Atribacterota bacterium]MDD5497316.1 stage 0 sporulation family protein [Atribacterota bacterium]
MPRVIGIQFYNSNFIYYFKHGKYVLEVGDLCVVKTSLGLDIGKVVTPILYLKSEELEEPLKKILRKATQHDIEKWKSIQIDEQDALRICQEKIKKYNLDMHLINCKYLFDKSRLIFYFYADNRIDFRELVKELASLFKTKIELKQIGVRDKAKMVGGLGICGRPLCCSLFLTEFKPVPINVAKMQSVALNLSKVSGTCGRLKCCLNFEAQFYKEELKNYPKLGTQIKTKGGKEGKVIEVNILSRYLVIETIEKEDNEHIKNRIKISLEEWQENHNQWNKEKINAKNKSTTGGNN